MLANFFLNPPLLCGLYFLKVIVSISGVSGNIFQEMGEGAVQKSGSHLGFGKVFDASPLLGLLPNA